MSNNWEQFCNELKEYSLEVGLSEKEVEKAIKENEDLLSWIFKKQGGK